MPARSRSSGSTCCGPDVIDRDPIQTAVRERRRRDRLPPGAACAFCGERSPFALRTVDDPDLDRSVRGYLERHHVLGRKTDPGLTIVLCLNHHAKATESLRRGGVPMETQRDPIERLIAATKAVETFLHDAQLALERWIQELEGLAAFLDGLVPDWRKRWERRE